MEKKENKEKSLQLVYQIQEKIVQQILRMNYSKDNLHLNAH